MKLWKVICRLDGCLDNERKYVANAETAEEVSDKIKKFCELTTNGCSVEIINVEEVVC